MCCLLCCDSTSQLAGAMSTCKRHAPEASVMFIIATSCRWACVPGCSCQVPQEPTCGNVGAMRMPSPHGAGRCLLLDTGRHRTNCCQQNAHHLLVALFITTLDTLMLLQQHQPVVLLKSHACTMHNTQCGTCGRGYTWVKLCCWLQACLYHEYLAKKAGQDLHPQHPPTMCRHHPGTCGPEQL